MSAAEEIARIAEACVVRPGDVLVLSFDYRMSHSEWDTITATVKAALPETMKVLVVDNSIHLHVLRSGEVAE